MANPEHIKWLNEGVAAWNERRRETDFTPNLQEADLQKVDLVMANLSGAKLEGADLRGADLRETNLQEADLRGANLLGANLAGADFRGANLIGADLREATLYRTDLRTIVYSAIEGNAVSIGEYTNLSLARNLTQSQLERAIGDNGTIIPITDHLSRPDQWDTIELPKNHPSYEISKEDPARTDETARGPIKGPSPIRYTPPTEFKTEDDKVALHHSPKPAEPRRPSAAPIDRAQCKAIRKSIGDLTHDFCALLQNYAKEDAEKSNRVRAAEQLLTITKNSRSNLRGKNFSPITFYNHTEILAKAGLAEIEALETVDKVTFEQLIEQSRKHYGCYPELPEALDSANTRFIPDDFPYSVANLTVEIDEIAFSVEGLKIFTEETRALLASEKLAPAPLGSDPEKSKQATLGAIVGEMWREMEPYRDKMKNVAAKGKDGVDQASVWLKTYEKVEKLWNAVKPFIGMGPDG